MFKTRNDLIRILRIGSSGVSTFTGLGDLDPTHKKDLILKYGPKNYMNGFINDMINWKEGKPRTVIENDDTKRGQKYEDKILDFFSEKTGKKILDRQTSYSVDESFFERFTVCKIDALIQDDNNRQVPLEVKCPKKIYEEIPFAHYVQVQFQMWCMGENVKYGYYFAITVDEDKEELNEDQYLAYKVLRDEDLIKEMKRRILHMFQNYVTENKIPETNEIFPYHNFIPIVSPIELDKFTKDYHMLD